MTRDDLRILCTALGFTAVIMKDVADNQVLRATSIAKLIEDFCITVVPEAFTAERNACDFPRQSIAGSAGASIIRS
ncbi:MAG: hypothetical protein WCD70_13760 [Alphaproteobacteria bacterium]